MPEVYPPYKPNPTPQFGDPAVTRFLDDELNRIAAMLAQINPSIAYVIATDTDLGVPVTTTPTWTDLFTASTEVVDVGGMFDPVTGIVTFHEAGVYQISATLRGEIIGGTGNRDFALGIRANWDGTPGSEWISSGTDEFPLVITRTVNALKDAGDTVHFEGSVYTSNPAGSLADLQTDLNIWRSG